MRIQPHNYAVKTAVTQLFAVTRLYCWCKSGALLLAGGDKRINLETDIAHTVRWRKVGLLVVRPNLSTIDGFDSSKVNLHSSIDCFTLS